MSFRLTHRAQAELDDAFDRYEAERAGLGAALVLEVLDVLELVVAVPGLGARIDGTRDGRRAVLRRFPYSVAYVAREGGILVLGVIHHKQGPSAWTGREPDE